MTVGEVDGIQVGSGQGAIVFSLCDGNIVDRVVGCVVGNSEVASGGGDGGSSMLTIHSQVGLAKILDGSEQEVHMVPRESDTNGR